MKNIVTSLPLGTYFKCLLEEKDKVKLTLCKNANDLQMQENAIFSSQQAARAYRP
jgi:hypothetical protein